MTIGQDEDEDNSSTALMDAQSAAEKASGYFQNVI